MESLKLSSEFLSDHPLGLVPNVLFIITFCFPFLSLIIFPFYVRVNRKNRKRDELVAVFPFTDYFYRVTCFTESSSILLASLSLIVFLVFKLTGTELLMEIIINSLAVLIIVKMNVTVVLNILISILAFYRFLLYFSPRTMEHSVISIKSFQRLVILLHLFFFFAFLRAIWVSPASKENDHYEEIRIFLYLLNGLVILCSLPYLLIILSIRKLTRLSSNRQSTPEKFIKYQILIIFISKVAILPFYCVVETPSGDGNYIFLVHLVYETMTMPLMVQVAYLLSNKTNLETFKDSVICIKAVQKRVCRMNSKVESMKIYTITTGHVETEV